MTQKASPHCHIHTDTALTCPKCLSAAGGRSTSPAKIAASRANAKLGGKLGGRPPKWEATIVDAHDQIRTVTVTGRTRKLARAALTLAPGDVVSKLERVNKPKRGGS